MGLVSISKESKLARDIYFLERSEVKTGQDIKRKQANKGHLLAGGARC